MTRFSFNNAVWEVPVDIDVVVTTKNENGAGDYFTDFDFTKNGEVIAMLGGTGENGEKLPTWDDVGIERVK